MPITQELIRACTRQIEPLKYPMPRNYGEWYKLGHAVDCQCDICKRAFGEAE